LISDFTESIKEFASDFIPSLLELLRKNAIANPEQLLLSQIEQVLVGIDSSGTEKQKNNKKELKSQ
jgi:hypothetical protein